MAGLLSGALQRLHILGKARAAVTGACIQEVVADPAVRADAAPHLFDVGAEPLGEVGEVVHERDARGEHCVGRVLGQFGRAYAHHHHPLVVALEGRIEIAQELRGALFVAADHDPVGPHEVLDGRAFLEELRVGHDAIGQLGPACGKLFGNRGVNLVRSAHRHGGLVHDHAVLGHVPADGAGGRHHVGQVGGAILAGRRADRDELQLAMRNARLDVGREHQAPRGAVARDDRLQPRLEDRQAARVQRGDLACIDVTAQHVVAGIRKASPRHQSHIPTANDAYFHRSVLTVLDRIPRNAWAGRSPIRRRRGNASGTV